VATAEGVAAAERVAARAAEPGEGRARVVLLALLRVGEDVVRGRDLLELFLGLVVAGVAVRVIFARQFPVRLLDLVLARVLADAEGLVELVCHFFSYAATTTRAGRIRCPSNWYLFCITSTTMPASAPSTWTVERASCWFGSNFSPLGSTTSTPALFSA